MSHFDIFIRNCLTYYEIAAVTFGVHSELSMYCLTVVSNMLSKCMLIVSKCRSKSLLFVFEFILHLSLTHDCLLTSISAIIIHENLETTTQNVSKQQRIYLYRLKILRHVYWDMHIETFILRRIIYTNADRILI